MPQNVLPPGLAVPDPSDDHLIRFLTEEKKGWKQPFPFVKPTNLQQTSPFIRQIQKSSPIVMMISAGVARGVKENIRHWRKGASRIMLDDNSWVRIKEDSSSTSPILYLGATGVKLRPLTQIFLGVWATPPAYYELMDEWTSDYVIIRS